MFLKLSGIFGESKNPRHIGEIEISSWEWDNKQAQVLGKQPGVFVSNTISSLTLTKARDTTSQILLEACLRGRSFTEARLTSENHSVGGNPNQAIVLKLKTVSITTIGTKDNSGGEFVTLSFEKVELLYR